MRTALFAALALLLAACGGGGSGDDEAGATSTSAPTSSTDPTGSVPDDGGERCRSSEGYEIAVPAGWAAVADCGQFGPAPLDEPTPGTDERAGVVTAYVDAVDFADVVEPSDEETARAVGVVDGRQAVRVVSEASGDGLHAAGTEVVRWSVDLALGVDDGDGTLFVDAVDVHDDVDFAAAVARMDAMVRSLEITAGDRPELEGVVARYEGGATPVTVTAAASASTPDTCLRVVASDRDPVCVEGVAGQDGIAVAEVDAAAGALIVGIVGPSVWGVEVEFESGASAPTVLPAGYEGRETRAFALPGALGDVTGLRLRGVDGEVLAEPAVADVVRPV